MKGFCGDYCLINPDLVYPLVTWLGWLNSGMNPVIYACWSRDFRRAFKKILCSWYKPKSNRGTKILQRPGGCCTLTGTVQSARYPNSKSTINSKKSIKIKSNQSKISDDDETDTFGANNDNINSDVDNYSPVEVFKQYNQSVYNSTSNSNHNNNSNNNKSPKCPNDSIGMVGLRSSTNSSFKSTRKESTVKDIFFLTKK